MDAFSSIRRTQHDHCWRFHRWTPLTREARWLLVVATIYFLLQIAIFNEARFLEWDEAIYIGAATKTFDPSQWAAHRSPGLLWVLRPYLAFANSLSGLRIYLALTSTAILTVGFSRWLRPIGILAPVSMGVFTVGWLTLFYGSEVSPNLYVAGCAVGAAGAFVSYRRSRMARDILLIASFVGGATFVRLSDGLVLAASIVAIAVVLLPARAAAMNAAGTITGMVLGATPWIVEASSRFGGPIARLRNASTIVDSGPRWNLSAHLRLLDGPLMGPDPAALSLSVLVLAIAGLLVGLVGLMTSRHRRSIGVAVFLAFAFAAPYFFYVGALAPRFLLPSYALWSIPVASGVLALLQRSSVLRIAVTVGAILALIWSLSTAVRIEGLQVEARKDAQAIGMAIADAREGRDCVVLAQYGYPQIAIGSGCAGAGATIDSLACVYNNATSNRERLEVVFVASIAEPTPEQLIYLSEVSPSESIAPWRLYRVDGELESLCIQPP